MLKEKSLEYRWLTVLFVLSAIIQTGCAEGPLWRVGKFSPWARNQWAEEERIADTLFERKRQMTESVSAALDAPVEQQQRVAEDLAEVVHRDPILLLRLHAVDLLGKLNCPAAVETLKDASRDHNSDLRVAAIKSWEKMPAETAIPQLQEMIGSDTDIDVRLAATRALGNFSGQQAVAAISLALEDPDPALQVRAAESLQNVTGEQLGRDIQAWQNYVKNVLPSPLADRTLAKRPVGGEETRTGISGGPGPRSDSNPDSIFR